MRRLIFVFMLLLIQDVGVVDAQSEVPEYREIWRLPSGCTIYRPFRIEYDFDSSGDYLAAMDTGCIINIWNISTGEVDRSFQSVGDEISSIQSVKWSVDDRYIAVGQSRNPISIYDAQTGENVYVLESYGSMIDWHPFENLLSVRNGVFDADTGELTRFDDSDLIWDFGGYWSPDGTMVASPAGREYIYMPLFTNSGELIDVYSGAESDVAWSPDSTRLASASQIRNVATGMPVTIMPLMGGIIRWHPQGDWIINAVGTFVDLWDVDTGERINLLEAQGCDYLNGLEISPTGRYIAANCVVFDQNRVQPPQNSIIVWEVIP